MEISFGFQPLDNQSRCTVPRTLRKLLILWSDTFNLDQYPSNKIVIWRLGRTIDKSHSCVNRTNHLKFRQVHILPCSWGLSLGWQGYDLWNARSIHNYIGLSLHDNRNCRMNALCIPFGALTWCISSSIGCETGDITSFSRKKDREMTWSSDTKTSGMHQKQLGSLIIPQCMR